MKKLLLISALFVIPCVNGMTIYDYDLVDHNIDPLLEKWGVNPQTFIKQDGCSSRMVVLKESDDDDDSVAVGVFSIKDPSIFAACCGGNKKAYIEALAVLPSYRRRKAATEVVMRIFKELQDTPDIEHVYALIARNNTTAEQFYKKIGFKEEPSPAWAPQKLTYSFSKKQN